MTGAATTEAAMTEAATQDENPIEQREDALPPDAPGRAVLPEKEPGAFRTIGEVAEDLDLPQHVLRFWETRFTQVRPLKRDRVMKKFAKAAKREAA